MSLFVGFTGTQEGLTVIQKKLLVITLRELKAEYSCVVHGDCIGADEEFGAIAARMNYFVRTRPGCDAYGNTPKRAYSYSDETFGAEPYLVRNHKIVDDCSILLACPKEMEEQLRSGTWATVRYARQIEKPLEIIYPQLTTRS